MNSIVSPVSVLNAAQASQVKSAPKMSKEAFEQTAKDFEAVFMSQMLKPMWEGVETDGLFGGGPGEDAMRDLLIQEYGKAMVRHDGYGLSPAIMNEMIRMQEMANSAQVGTQG